MSLFPYSLLSGCAFPSKFINEDSAKGYQQLRTQSWQDLKLSMLYDCSFNSSSAINH